MPVAIDVLVAVHHPLRRRLLDYLSVEGPAKVGTLAAHLDQQVGSISHHLRMLERVGVVERAPS
ncbi:ArsR/SmtB family transcription factor [Cellulomonas soli]